MRIRGRRLYPSTLAERRVMMSLGGTPLYAPRGISPYVIARRLARSARGESTDDAFLKAAFARQAQKGGITVEAVAPPDRVQSVEAISGEATIAA